MQLICQRKSRRNNKKEIESYLSEKASTTVKSKPVEEKPIEKVKKPMLKSLSKIKGASLDIVVEKEQRKAKGTNQYVEVDVTVSEKQEDIFEKFKSLKMLLDCIHK